MINLIKKFFFGILVVLFISFNTNYSFGEKSQENQYISLHPLSSNNDVKKFQKFFKALKIYKGNVDGKYENIKPYITIFQIKNKIIKSKKDTGAGYIGPKTYSFLNKKYGKNFKKVYLKFFGIKEPQIGKKQCFIISAYYSPLPGQKKYSTGTYYGDIKLNGDGTHGASGNKVHPGFIAAPTSYPFGTKIKLNGIGIGVIEDRGGAIVRKGVLGHNCDRLDIWMGFGDEGLKRALKIGKREVKGEIVEKNSKITINFPEKHTIYLAKKISPKSKETDIKKMQDLFNKAKISTGKVDGKYSNFKKSIISFQIKHKLIKNKYDNAAGYIGPKTIKKLEKIYPNIFIIARKKDIEKNSIVPLEGKKNLKSDKNVSENKITIKSTTEEKILAKYNLSKKEKENLDSIIKKILNSIDKKTKNNNLKRKSSINKIKRRIKKIIKKIKNKKTLNKLIYLKDVLKEMSK